MTYENHNQPSLLEIVNAQIKAHCTESRQVIALNLPPESGVEGVVILWQLPLPSIH